MLRAKNDRCMAHATFRIVRVLPKSSWEATSQQQPPRGRAGGIRSKRSRVVFVSLSRSRFVTLPLRERRGPERPERLRGGARAAPKQRASGAAPERRLLRRRSSARAAPARCGPSALAQPSSRLEDALQCVCVCVCLFAGVSSEARVLLKVGFPMRPHPWEHRERGVVLTQM